MARLAIVIIVMTMMIIKTITNITYIIQCIVLIVSVSKVFSVTEAAARVASGHKYKGTSSRNTNTKKLAQEIQIQIQKNTTTNPEIQNH